jgi:SpoVK/Ycf46/Vps4 family AAA+-type ATPase
MAGSQAIKKWVSKDLQNWRDGRLRAVPKGYLLCGPVGTGKTFLAECMAGEAGVPTVALKNFRERWVGTSEGNLEKVFRILRALGRCMVFVDEADQALGRRVSEGDGGLSGRLYSMIAKEMGKNENRGRIVWILASSRPDLIEVDLKRPGRVDVKIPILPTATCKESMDLIRALLKRNDLTLSDEEALALQDKSPLLMTAGAAEALAAKVMRVQVTSNRKTSEILAEILEDYQPSVPMEVIDFQIDLAVKEATDIELVPKFFQNRKKQKKNNEIES